MKERHTEERNTQYSNKDGYIIDFISGKEIKGTPEEIDATQPFSKILIQDYFYTKDQIQTRPQWRVKSSPSDKNGNYPIDIAIFKNDQKKDEDLYIIVECKKKTQKDGLKQLKDYLKLSSAELGVWFNGNDTPVYIQKITKSNGIDFQQIPNIPKRGERVQDIGNFKRGDLIVPHNLKTIFRILRSHLAGNAVGTTRDEELARQLINIIFTKLYDEKFKSYEEIVDFRAGVDEEPIIVKKRIDEIFIKVKAKYKDIIEFNEFITLDANSIYYVVGQLQNYCLVDAQRDVIADAFETFIGYALKGPQGQFFTPRNIVTLMVEILDQTPDEMIIDPACGSGGFIVESLRHIWKALDEQGNKLNWGNLALNEEKQKAGMSKIYGIEKDSFLSKVAKAYMAILGDGKGGIFCEDSLEKPENWARNTQQSIRLNSFDCLLANPPFGKDIKVIGIDKLSQYKLAKKWKKEDDGFKITSNQNTEMPPQILFIERCLDFLQEGGRLGIIIPETYFHAPMARYVMEFMAKHNIFCLIDLPHNTFRPHNNAKCIAIFIQKNKPQQEKIMMCAMQEMGHDHQGKEIYRWNSIDEESSGELWDDIPLIIDEINHIKAQLPIHKEQHWIQTSLLHNKTLDGKYVFWIESQEVQRTKVYVPRYYWKKKEEDLGQFAEKEGCELISINDLITSKIITYFDGHGSPESENKGKGEIPYIRVKDIVNWEIYKDPTSKIPLKVYQEMHKESKRLQEGDILYVRRGSYRIGSVAMVSRFDTEVLLTREILVLRVKEQNKLGITPYYLLYLLSHQITQEQAKNKILIETTLPNIADRWRELKLPIHKNKEKIKDISERIKSAIDAKWSAIEKIQNIAKELGALTT
ncbi:DNA methyltransferase [Helicobacter sp. 13S00482-2]|uniref:N-6 DNA methylase n=1 Tax=Helicobacter sp. 13S00482-2 TaxID=1476200 RepID=UPI000BA56015|nr:N-6 DNA methylase [Helicobacter sp. 13S00482-2]PAF53818.1 DNA methyltransferase [Helicobacter sp. 13S00482-2]